MSAPPSQATRPTVVSPISHRAYEVPEAVDDRGAIDAFVARHPGRPVVVVQGLGFVGAVMSLVCANALNGEYAVIGVDLPRGPGLWKINDINSGTFPVVASDPKIEAFYREARRKGNLLATGDPYAYAKADVVVVDINLDVAKESAPDGSLVGYDVDLGAFRGAIRSIGDHCRPEVLVLVETTVPPGTCRHVALPILREALGARGLPADRFALGHSYERVMPGPNYVDSIQNFYRVYSGIDEASATRTEAFLRTIIRTDEYPLTRLGSTNATEMAKVLENSYRAMNIAFAVEWSRFAEESGVNFYEVVDAIRLRPTHANLMYPGIGVGGYCLTKDPLLASWARTALLGGAQGLANSEDAVRTNDQMPRYAFERLVATLDRDRGEGLDGTRILLLGVSYRSDVGDTRYSPVELFYRLLVRAGATVTLVDPYVEYWDEVDRDVEADLSAVAKTPYDIVAVTTAHREFDGRYVGHFLAPGGSTLIYDTVGRLSQGELDALRTRARVSVLGRGDL